MKKLLITFCWLTAGLVHCFGQMPAGKPVKKIHLELQHSRTDTARLRLLHAEGDYYYLEYRNNPHALNNLDSAYQLFHKALKLSAKIKLDTGYGKYQSLIKLGQVLVRKGDTTRGLQFIRQAAAFYHDIKDNVKEANTLFTYYKCVSHYNTAAAIKGMHQLLTLCAKTQQNDLAVNVGYNCVLLYYDINITESERICIQLIRDTRFKKCTNLYLIYSMLSGIYRYNGNLDKSLQVCLEAIRWMDETQAEKAAIIGHELYGELGLVYQDLGQIENSIYWYRRTIEARERLQIDQRLIFRTAGFMIEGMIKLQKTKEGLRYLNALIKRKPPVNDVERADISQIKAYCYDDLKQYNLAEYYYKMALLLDVKEKDPEIAWRVKFNLASFYVRQQKYSSANRLLKDLANEDKPLSWTRELTLLWFKIDSAQGRAISAIRRYQLYKKLNDSIFNIAKSQQISELQIKYATDQKENDIKSLKKNRLLQDRKIRQERTTRNSMLGGVIILLIVLALLYKSLLINKKNSKEIDAKNSALNNLIAEKDDLLQDKEWLIKEIHHRVKNNLQIVMGLLQRQSSFINNKEALAAIQNSELRMNSIALIHQKLYQSESFKLVNMKGYINEMIEYLQDSFDFGASITFEKAIDEIDFDISTAVPLGLILNEAITNAIKYAFPGQDKGRIRIVLQQTGDNTFLLEIADDGRGLPEGFDMTKADSLGFNLIRGLSKQLGGKVVTKSGPGLTITLRFKV